MPLPGGQSPGMFGLTGGFTRGRPNEPFFVGRGGRHMSMDEIELQRRLAAQEIAQAGDFSPVGHWTQGLARSLGAVTGGLKMRRADKEAAAVEAESDAVTKALLGNPAKETVLSAMADPRLTKGARSVAELLAEQMFAKPPAPTEFERALAAGGILPGTPEYTEANRRLIAAKTDPFTVLQMKSGTMAGPQSLVELAIRGGGDRSSGAPQTMAPPAEAIAELKNDPSSAAEFDEAFGPGAAARILGGGAGNGAGPFPG